jgi:integrase
MKSAPLLDRAGRRRSPATLTGYHQGRPPRNKGLQYPPDPPSVEEIVAVMRAAGDDPDGVRLRGLIVVLWRAGLRISEALALSESDLDPARGSVLVRRGKGGKRREVGMDRWAWEQLARGSGSEQTFRSARCSACYAVRLAAGRAQQPGSACSCATPRSSPESGDGLPRTNSVTRTRSKCPERVYP